MYKGIWTTRAIAAASLLAVLGISARAADPMATGATSTSGDVGSEINSLKQRIADLESKENQNWLTDERASQIRGIVEDVLKDAKARGQFADGVETGYKDGFYIQTPNQDYKLVISGFAQLRYEFAQTNAWNNRTLPSRSVGSGSSATSTTPHDPGNSNGFDIRRARISFSGNIFSPKLTYKFEGDFYGNATGNFTVTDAFVGYAFNDLFKLRLGSYKVPFAKGELTSDTAIQIASRSEVLAPFDPVRSLGLSLYGEIIPSTLGYEVSINDGGSNAVGNSVNTLRRDDTIGGTANLDNRLGYYMRVQWAGNGKLSDFSDESDLKGSKDFIWLLGGAVGYESQNATNNAFPSPQQTTTGSGISNGTGPGFTNATLNGDIYRGTLDWSAKYQGFSFNSAGYIQQFNFNPGNTSSSSAKSISYGPYGAKDSSFFQWGGYGQLGYFIIPQKLELTGRVGILGTEGYPNLGEYYTAGMNYYVYGHNFKILSDVTYTPEAAYTDSSESLLQNTHDVIFRVQVQLKF